MEPGPQLYTKRKKKFEVMYGEKGTGKGQDTMNEQGTKKQETRSV